MLMCSIPVCLRRWGDDGKMPAPRAALVAGGMPDLLLWHPGRRAAKLSEVKGPRDRLSDQQRAWIAALEDAGLRAEVLKVVEPAAAGGGGGRRGGKARRR